MSIVRNSSRFCIRRIIAWLGKGRNFSISLCRLVKSVNAEQERVNCHGIQIFTTTNDSLLNNYTSAACGHDFTVFCVDGHQLTVSGVNGNSQLGLPSCQNDIIDKPKKVKLPFVNPQSKILDVNCGRLHTVVSTTEGLFASGCNTLGQCGLKDKEEITSFTKIPLTNQNPVKQIVCGLDHTLILTDDGAVWSSGWSTDGQTGLGHINEQRTFARVLIPSDLKISKVSTKGDSCLALSTCGQVFSWGNAEYSQTGFSTEQTLTEKPTKITALQNVVDIAVANSVGLALSGEGDVYTWGYGLLGNTFEPCFCPTPQRLTFFDTRVVKIDCGLDYYVLLTNDNEIYIWGKLGQRLYSPLPKKVNLSSNAVKINCGIDEIAVLVEV